MSPECQNIGEYKGYGDYMDIHHNSLEGYCFACPDHERWWIQYQPDDCSCDGENDT